MRSLGSFSTIRNNATFYVRVKHFRWDAEDVFFQFDTGAAVSLIGLNTICDDDEKKKDILRKLILREVSHKGIDPHRGNPKTVTRQELVVYPCKMDGVSIMGTHPITLFFHVYLGDVNTALLGYDYIDACAFRHAIGGDIDISAVADHVGRTYYPGRVLDFSSVLKEYYRICS